MVVMWLLARCLVRSRRSQSMHQSFSLKFSILRDCPQKHGLAECYIQDALDLHARSTFRTSLIFSIGAGHDLTKATQEVSCIVSLLGVNMRLACPPRLESAPSPSRRRRIASPRGSTIPSMPIVTFCSSFSLVYSLGVATHLLSLHKHVVWVRKYGTDKETKVLRWKAVGN